MEAISKSKAQKSRADSSSKHEKAPRAANPLAIQRTGLTLRADPARVLIRPFNATTEQRAKKICARVLALTENEVQTLLEQVHTEFGDRHLRTREFFQRRFEHARQFLAPGVELSEQRQLLL